MAKGYVPIFFDWVENTQDLSAEEKGNLIDAVVLYASGADEWVDLLQTSGEKIAFRFMRGQVDRNIEISRARARAGSNKKEQDESNENKPEQRETKTPRKKKKENEKEELNESFEAFWKEYPRKVNKPAAKKAFEKINPGVELLATMLEAVRKQIETAQWKESERFIPHPATWLNGRRWEDEIKVERPKGSVSAQQYSQRDYDDEQEEAIKRMLEGVV